jgi:hypothetical protein
MKAFKLIRPSASLELPYIVPALRPLAAKLSTLKPNPKNARLHPEQNVRRIAAAMKEYGWDVPMVVNERSGIIVKGHGRFLGARHNQWKYGPVVTVKDSDPRSVARALSDNALSDDSAWDFELLRESVEETEFTSPHLRRMFDELVEDGGKAKGGGTEREDVEYEKTVEGMELKPYEHYDYVVVLADNLHDWNRLVDVFGLGDVYSNVTKRRVGLGRGVRASTLLKLLAKKGKA